MEYVIVPLSVMLGVVGYGLIAGWYLVPVLDAKTRERALVPLILPHVFRYIGLWFLIPGVAAPGLSRAFAVPAAYGDLITAGLALLAALALRGRVRYAMAIVWLFNLFGSADLLNALLQGMLRIGHPGQLGAAYLIPVIFVPAMLVAHFLIFRTLIRAARGAVPGS